MRKGGEGEGCWLASLRLVWKTSMEMVGMLGFSDPTMSLASQNYSQVLEEGDKEGGGDQNSMRELPMGESG